MLIESSNVTQIGSVRRSWSQRFQDASSRFDPLLPDLLDQRAAFVIDGPGPPLEALIYGLHWDLDFGIIEASRLTGALISRLDGLGIARVDTHTGSITRGPRSASREAAGVFVMTSGTTGTMKPIAHTWRTLNTLDRVRSNQPRFWFVPYQPGSYAWYQMMCLGLFRPGQDLYCPPSSDPIEGFRGALDAGITAVSSTPTFWRCAFLALDSQVLQQAPIQTISLGGEIVDQAILDDLKATYPSATIRHIYASSEAGAAIVVTDGRAGFPVDRLTQESICVKVEDGRLHVRSPYTTASAGGAGECWVDTGDRVEVRGDRVYFLGRAEESTINVGGMKAYPSEIEAAIMGHPNVIWAQVYARRAPLVGSLPAARVVLRSRCGDTAQEENALASFARASLPEHAVPRTWRFLDEIPMMPSLKTGETVR